MKVLVACEESGTVREAFKKIGHDAWSCDLKPTKIPGQHYQGDVFNIINNWDIIGGKPDLLIGHPECTYLANSGVRWLYHPDYPDRWEKMEQASRFFKRLWNLDIPYICLENPIPHKHGKLPPYTQIVHPWMFGHPERKSTCLWLKGLSPLKQTNNVYEEMLKLPRSQQHRIHYMSGKDRAERRSKTFSGLADAMAAQWDNYPFYNNKM